MVPFASLLYREPIPAASFPPLTVSFPLPFIISSVPSPVGAQMAGRSWPPAKLLSPARVNSTSWLHRRIRRNKVRLLGDSRCLHSPA